MQFYHQCFLLFAILVLQKSLVSCLLDNCPNAADILPCTCGPGELGFPNFDCSLATTQEEIEQAFQAYFPKKSLNRFTIFDNNAIRNLTRNVLADITFKGFYIHSTKITSITASFLENSYETVIEMHCYINKLETFPLEVFSNFVLLELLDLQRNSLSFLPKLSSPTINYLNFEDNNFDIVQEFTFSDCPNLEYLFLSNNKITVLPTSTFLGATSLLDLELTNNLITHLRPGVFSGFPNLLYIYVDENPITTIDDAAFNDLTGLGIIKLSNALFTSIGNEIFYNVPALEYFTLKDSQLQTIEPNTFVGFRTRNLIKFILHDNNIATVVKDAFSGIVTAVISLYNNNISTIEPEAFKDLTDSTLSLHHNSITTLDETWLRSILETGNEVIVYSNPLECGCDVAWLFDSPLLFHKLTYDPTCSNGTLLHDLNGSYFTDNC